MTVTLLLPGAETTQWGIDDLMLGFEKSAEAVGGEQFDDSEEEGEFEVLEFAGLTPEQVRDMAKEVLRKREIQDIIIDGD